MEVLLEELLEMTNEALKSSINQTFLRFPKLIERIDEIIQNFTNEVLFLLKI